MRKGWVRVLSGFLAAVFAVSMSGCSGSVDRIGQTVTQEGGKETFPGKTEAASAAAATPSDAPEFKVGKMGDDYILPDAPDHVYTGEELSGLTPAELRIARNEIYARHGRRFKSDDLNQYFSGKSWYRATTDPGQFNMDVLNQDELDNLKVIQHAEQGKAVCTIPKIGTEDFPKIDGSTATLPLSQAIYRMSTGASAKEAETAIVHSKTTEAWEDLLSTAKPVDDSPLLVRANITDMVIAYEPGADLKKALEKPDSGITIKPIGRDALVFLENQSNPVHSLTQSQIVDIYTGKVDNWKDVGGKDEKIQAFQRPEDSGSQNLMNKLVMKGKKMALAPQDHIVGEMGDLVDEVAAFDDTGDALGYSVYYYAKNMYEKPGLSFMAVDGVAPSSDTIRNGSYPYVNVFYAAIRTNEPKDSKAHLLFDWLTSDDGQSLINGLGYVGISQASKSLPQDLLSDNDDHFTGTIPLHQGDVILGAGSYLYGEVGTCVFDSEMHLLKFISHVVYQGEEEFTECPQDSVIFAQNAETGDYGHYSLKDGRWVDHKDDWEEDFTLVDSAAFAASHPEILKEYGATADQVEVYYYYEDSPGTVCIKTGDMEHFFDEQGRHLLDYDTAGKTDEEIPGHYVMSVDDHTAYLALLYYVDGRDGEPASTKYQIYKDGKLFKTLTDNQDGTVADIEGCCYTRIRGNYVYVYNYEDEPCARFLMGYYQDD